MSLVTLQRSPESSEFEFDLNTNNHKIIDDNQYDVYDSTITNKSPLSSTKSSPLSTPKSSRLNNIDNSSNSHLPKCYSVKKNLLIHKKHEQLIENYFVIKDAALILPKRVKNSSSSTTITSNNISINSQTYSEEKLEEEEDDDDDDDESLESSLKESNSNAGDILIHLQSMVSLLRPHDTITLAVKLSSYINERIRYLVIVETIGKNDKEECAIIGFDLKILDKTTTPTVCTIGLVLPIDSNSDIILDGDGGIKFQTHNSVHLFKPVSIQAMWSAYQCLHKALDLARKYNYYPNGINHDWLAYYNISLGLKSDQQLINEWNQREERSAQREDYTTPYFDCLKLICNEQQDEQLCCLIKDKLKDIMISFKDDYGSMNSISIRQILEKEIGKNLDNYKKFIDGIIFQYYNQLVEHASQIDEHLYLGTEWNASDYDSLINDKVTHILNVSREVDNFFADSFKYLNIRVLDVDDADLLKEFDRTYKFINEAKEQSSACFVHCKMGVSRSASIVIAYIMKEKSLNLEQAFHYVKNKRSCINPNKGFMSQLTTYESILNAHKSKYNLFGDTNLQTNKSNEDLIFFDENYPQQGLVKEAINRIKAKSSSSDLNFSSIAPPSSPLITDDNQISYFTEKTLKKTQSSIRRCQSMKFRESPKLDIKRTPSQNETNNVVRVNFSLGNNESVKKLAEDFDLTIERNSKKTNSQKNLDLDGNFVPSGIVKRQVESINFKSRPCTPEDDNDNEDCCGIQDEQNYYSSSSSSSSYLPNSASPPRTQNSPDSKRCKIETTNLDQETTSLTRDLKAQNRSNKKVFEFLADKLKETTNDNNTTNLSSPLSLNDNFEFDANSHNSRNSTRRLKRETSKYHPLTILANKN